MAKPDNNPEPIEMGSTTWLVDLGHRGTLLASGPDRVTWLEGLLSCEVAKLTPEQALWGLTLTKQGKITSDLFLLQSERGIFLSTGGEVAPELHATFDRHLIMEDAEIEELTSAHRWLLLLGPEARSLLAQVPGAGVVATSGFPALGDDAVLVLVLASEVEALMEQLVEAGGRLADDSGWAALRVLGGVPEWGADYDATSTPHEAGIAHQAVSWTKGCYLGQEVVCMQDMRGKVRRQLVGLRLGGGTPPGAAIGDAVIDDAEKPVGELRTVAADPAGVVAWGLLQTKALGGSLRVAGRSVELLRPPAKS